jgi:hypothetical protein
MGVATVWLTYDLVRRRFGRAAGFAGGLVLALTPISVAISRHDNPDALLILCVVAALWFTVRALEDGRAKWLVWAGVMVGLGFEAKMGAALLVVPGIAGAWLWVAPRGRRAALKALAGFSAAAAAVGLAWPVLVWLTPAADRPWVSGTADNSIWSLITGYNGLGRLAGQAGGPGGMAGGPGGGGGAGGVFGGPTGPLRLLESSLGGQAGWMLGFAVAAGVAVLVASRLERTDARTGWLIAVGGAFATTAVAFSYASGIFHPYYVSELAPFTAMLVGGGVGVLAAGDARMRVLAPVAVAAGIGTVLLVVHNDTTGMGWVAPLVLIAGAAAAVVLARRGQRRVRLAALGVALAALLAAPAAWAFQTPGHVTSGTFPAGGPAGAGGFGGPGGGPGGLRGGLRGGFTPPGGTPPTPGGTAGGAPMMGGGGGGPFGGQDLSTVLSYIKAHGGGTLGVSSQSGAGRAIISGGDVAGIGGFSGRESEVSAAWLAEAVRDGRISWVLGDGSGGFGGPQDARAGSRTALAAVQQACTATTDSTTSGTLYDCRGKAGRLAMAGAAN